MIALYDKRFSFLIGPCTVNPCMNGGTCSDDNGRSGSYNCTCLPDYTGTDCNEVINDCVTPDIINCNSGTCMDGNQTFSCICDLGFTGDRCETDIDFCDHLLCLNGGVCIEGLGTETRCNCLFGFSGERCETDDVFCQSEQCSNGGTCVEGIGAATSCLCENGFAGDSCDNDINTFCTDSACSYHGECVDGYGASISCVCDPRYSGNNCEVDKCDFFTCLNGGTCVESSDAGVTCTCSEGFTGTNCENVAMDITTLPPTYSTSTCSSILALPISTC